MVTVLKDVCVGCSLCVPICEEKALFCYGLAYVTDDCTGCLDCIECCPVEALQESEQEE